MAKEPVIRKGLTRAEARRQRIEYWRKIFQDQARSELSAQAFCRKRRLSSHKYYWWKREVRRSAQNRSKSASARSAFARVEILPPRKSEALAFPIPSCQYEISLRGNRKIRIGEDFHPEVLKKLVQALEDLPC